MRFGWLGAVAIVLGLVAWAAIRRVDDAPVSSPPPMKSAALPLPLREELVREAREFDLPPPPPEDASVEELRTYQAKLTAIISGAVPATQATIDAVREQKLAVRKKMAEKHREAVARHRADVKGRNEKQRAERRAMNPKPSPEPDRKPYPPELQFLPNATPTAPPPSAAPKPSPS